MGQSIGFADYLYLMDWGKENFPWSIQDLFPSKFGLRRSHSRPLQAFSDKIQATYQKSELGLQKQESREAHLKQRLTIEEIRISYSTAFFYLN